MRTKAIVIIIAVGLLGLLGAANLDKKPAYGANSSAGQLLSGQSATRALASQTAAANKNYRDGTYSGSAIDTPYGTVQVAAVVASGKITDVKFLQMPFDEGHSREVTAFAEPQLKAMAINTQSAQVDFVSGATDTTMGFEQSLQAALDQAAQS